MRSFAFQPRQIAAVCALCVTLTAGSPAAVLAQQVVSGQATTTASGAAPATSVAVPASGASATTAVATPAAPTTQTGIPVPPEIAARSYLLIDITANNQILAAKDIDAVMEPASLTKLMTAYVVFEALKSGKIRLEQTFGVSERAWKMPGSRMFIRPNTQVPVEDLLKGMIVQSGNDASVALAEGLLGSQEAFVQHMNATAQKLGMHNTGYRNPEGLTANGHTTTARDMALLSTRLLADFPEYTSYYAMKSYRYPGTPETNSNNRNRLLFQDPSVDGLKTGHTAAAGYNLIATANRPSPSAPQGRRLLAIVFGAASETSRAEEAMKLLNWGYGAFETVQLLEANHTTTQARVWKGASKHANLGTRQAVVVAIPTGQRQNITTQSVVQNGQITAPVAADQALGEFKASLNGQMIASVPLVALQEVQQGGFFSRLWDAFLMLFNK